MSELFDSLNLSNSGPSSSQLSSSQPSTSKVFWHASPSPGVLRHLTNRTPSRSQDSPTLPLCTQAFVGELKKLPGALEAQSPLVSRDVAKRKLVGSSRKQSRNVSDPTTAKEKSRGLAVLEISDDDDEDVGLGAGGSRRLLLGDAGESSPESRRRRTMDAGNTGRLRSPSPPFELSSSSRAAPLPAVQHGLQLPPSHRRLDRRHSRRRKRESLMAGLGFTDESGSDCLKLFEDLQAAIQGIHAPHAGATGRVDAMLSSTGQHTARSAECDQPESNRLTPREGINRTTSAPTPSRMSQPDLGARSLQLQDRLEESLPRRVFRPVKSDHDVFNAARQDDERQARILQPRPTNLPAHRDPPVRPEHAVLEARSQSGSTTHLSQSKPDVGALETAKQTHLAFSPHVADAHPPRVEAVVTPTSEPPAVARPANVHADTGKGVAAAGASPVKRSARIEAMQQTSTGKKLGVRAPSTFAKVASASPRKAVAGSAATGVGRKLGTSAARTRPHPLPGMSQARQPGLPRNSSQYVVSPSQSAATTTQASGPAAPFRPPAISRTAAARTPHKPASPPPNRRTANQSRGEHVASSDDSFADDDDAFLALACELEY